MSELQIAALLLDAARIIVNESCSDDKSEHISAILDLASMYLNVGMNILEAAK